MPQDWSLFNLIQRSLFKKGNDNIFNPVKVNTWCDQAYNESHYQTVGCWRYWLKVPDFLPKIDPIYAIIFNFVISFIKFGRYVIF